MKEQNHEIIIGNINPESVPKDMLEIVCKKLMIEILNFSEVNTLKRTLQAFGD